MSSVKEEEFYDCNNYQHPSETVKRDVGEFVYCRYCNLVQLNSIGLHLHCFVCPLRYAMIIIVPWKYITPCERMNFSHIKKKFVIFLFLFFFQYFFLLTIFIFYFHFLMMMMFILKETFVSIWNQY